MTCHEIEALRLGLMNVLGTEDESARRHAEEELEGEMEGPIEALANAETLSEVGNHLDTAIVELEEEVAETSKSDPEYDYLRGRLVAVRDAERAVRRLTEQGESVFESLGDSHDLLHETFPADTEE